MKNKLEKIKNSNLFSWLVTITCVVIIVALLGGFLYYMLAITYEYAIAEEEKQSVVADTPHYDVQAENFSVSFKELNDYFLYYERTCVVYYRNSVHGGEVLVPYLDIDGVPFYYDKDTNAVKKLNKDEQVSGDLYGE